MKIIFVNRFFYPDHSATAQLLSDLAFDLAARDGRVMVITSRQRIDDPYADLLPAERVHGVDVHRIWTTRSGRASLGGRAMDYLTFYASAGWRLFSECDAGDLVIAKTDPPLMSVVASWVARWRGARQINWLHDLFPETAVRLGVNTLAGWPAALLRRLRNTTLERAHLNVVLGRRMASVLRSEGVSEGRVRIIPNWCDGATVRPVPRARNTLRKAWKLDDRFVVMYSGNMGRAHEFETLVAAARILRERADIVFLLIGDGVRRRWIETEIARRGLRNVSLKPYQPKDQLGKSLGVGDVHLVSLRPELEGLIVPSKFYGIAAAGRPTIFIGSPEGEIASILAENHCGITVPPGDGEGLADTIRGLAGDPRTRRAMGRAARRVFERSFDKPIALAAWRAAVGLEQVPGC